MSSTSMPLAPSNDTDILRLQGDPLPSKRGEIGYIGGAELPTQQDTTSNAPVLPARHPADRDNSPPSDGVTLPVQSEVVTSSSSEGSSCTASITKRHGILDFLFKSEKSPAFGGLRLTTLWIFAAQIALVGGTVTAWVFTIKCLVHLTSTGQNSFAGQPLMILIHLVFITAVFVQLIFLERRIFRLRGERYSYLHPGEVLPCHRSNNIPETSTDLAFAPWNRPPLPTYAAALAQSGVGTGDVEDNLLAVSPPPAYGNTRDSTLLLSAFLRNSLVRAQSRRSDSSPAAQEFNRDRPVSYVSRDEQWDGVQDARRLGEMMGPLEPLSAAHVPRDLDNTSTQLGR